MKFCIMHEKQRKSKLTELLFGYLKLIIAFYNNSITETQCILLISSLYCKCILVVLSVGDDEKDIFIDVIKLYGLLHSA